MPRGPRLDVPGALHHVMARGIERRQVFRDDVDRDDFLSRLGSLAGEKAWVVYAWALLPNHFHLLVRTARQPLPRCMRRLMTGYAGFFNRRHGRSGHVFQNRYKSVVVEEESYFLELVRYLHLNPVRAGVVGGLDELDRYAYAGHSALIGHVERDWQETEAVLERYGRTLVRARRAYRRFLQEGMARGRRSDLVGGGLVRSAGGWAAVRELRRGREAYLGDERVLGSSRYVERLLKEMEGREAAKMSRGRSAPAFEELAAKMAKEWGVSVGALTGGGRARRVSQARAALAHAWVEEFGRSGVELARRMGVKPQSVYEAIERARSRAGG
ncbi:MAG: transposase [Nitrospirae bacterium]|nr:transposase [Nitrospirota bacterium]